GSLVGSRASAARPEVLRRRVGRVWFRRALPALGFLTFLLFLPSYRCPREQRDEHADHGQQRAELSEQQAALLLQPRLLQLLLILPLMVLVLGIVLGHENPRGV